MMTACPSEAATLSKTMRVTRSCTPAAENGTMTLMPRNG
jgi:hypothetical protein